MDTKNERRTEADMQPSAPAGAPDAISPPSPTSVELPSIPGVLETSPAGEVAVVHFLAARICGEGEIRAVKNALVMVADVFRNIVFDFSKVEMFSTDLLGTILRTRRMLSARWQPRWPGNASDDGIQAMQQMCCHNFDDVESAIRTIEEEDREASFALCGIKPKLWDSVRILIM